MYFTGVLVYLFCSALVCFKAAAQVELQSTVSGDTHKPHYKVDHFSRNDNAWRTFFHNNGFRNEYSYNFLEVGSLEGRSAVWLLENVLQHPNSKLSCVDMWNESIDDDEYNADLMTGIYNRFLNNISPYRQKVDVYRGKSFDALRHPQLTQQSFDVVYVDGGHKSRNALEDAILSFGLLKVGGFMIFDDYFSNMKDPHHMSSPKLGIDTFLTMYTGSVSIVNFGYQLFVIKTAE